MNYNIEKFTKHKVRFKKSKFKEVSILEVVDVIKEKIKNNGIKQTFLAQKLDMPRQQFSQKLQKKTFKVDEVFKLADILNIDLNQFKEA